jgi:hypothetical protein
MKILSLFSGVNIVFRLRTGASRGRVPAEARGFSLLENIHASCGDHPGSYSTRNVVSSPGVKHQGRENNHLPPTNDDVKNEWNFNSTSATRLQRDNFYNAGF